MKKISLTVMAFAVLAALPAEAARKGVSAGGAVMPISSVADLTKAECRKLGGRVQEVQVKFCKSGSQCLSEARNPDTGDIERHEVCIDEKVK